MVSSLRLGGGWVGSDSAVRSRRFCKILVRLMRWFEALLAQPLWEFGWVSGRKLMSI